MIHYIRSIYAWAHPRTICTPWICLPVCRRKRNKLYTYEKFNRSVAKFNYPNLYSLTWDLCDEMMARRQTTTYLKQHCPRYVRTPARKQPTLKWLITAKEFNGNTEPMPNGLGHVTKKTKIFFLFFYKSRQAYHFLKGPVAHTNLEWSIGIDDVILSWKHWSTEITEFHDKRLKSPWIAICTPNIVKAMSPVCIRKESSQSLVDFNIRHVWIQRLKSFLNSKINKSRHSVSRWQNTFIQQIMSINGGIQQAWLI